MRDEVTAMRAQMERRRQAYRAIFESLDANALRYRRVRFLVWLASWLLPKDLAWAEVFRGALVHIVLYELMEFCRVRKTTFVPNDSHETALNEGRRLVWLFIQKRLRMTPADIEDLEEEKI